MPESKRTLPEVAVLLTLMDEAFEKKSWHGPNLRGSVRGVTAREAAWRPAPGRHNIAELVVHAAYWKYVTRRQITGEKRGGFPLEGSNWFDFAAFDSATWKKSVELLSREHKALRLAVAGLTPADRQNGDAWHTKLRYIRGVISHDLYHAGQIQVLKRLCRANHTNVNSATSGT
jgi:SpoVK/Ycf46/Vps4 family AAA+-type ATPase